LPPERKIAPAIVAHVPPETAASQLGTKVDNFRDKTRRLFRRLRVPGPEEFVALLYKGHDAWQKDVTAPLGCHLRANPAGTADLPNEHRFVELLSLCSPKEYRHRRKRARKIRPSPAERFALGMPNVHKQLARDAVEAAYARAVNRLHTFVGKSKLRTWFFGIVRREVLRLTDLLWRKRHGGREEVPFSVEASRRTVACEVKVPGQEWSESLLVDRSRMEPLTEIMLQETIDGLSERQRQVYEMVVQERRRPCEVAEILGISETNVRVNLHIARTKLRETLE
jgi:RNA polymerase sigma factor (sigma-70 family)